MSRQETVSGETNDLAHEGIAFPRLLITLLGLIVIGEWLFVAMMLTLALKWDLASVSHLEGLALQVIALASMLVGRFALPVLIILGAIRYIQRRRDGIAAMFVSGLLFTAIAAIFLLPGLGKPDLGATITLICFALPGLAGALLGYRYRLLFSSGRSRECPNACDVVEDA